MALYDCIETTNHIHLVMEFCPWGDLSVFLKKRDSLGKHNELVDIFQRYPSPPDGGLNQVLVIHFLQQMAAALKFMRDMELIHRDIKPQNVLVCPSLAWLERRGEDNEKRGLLDRSQLIPTAGIPTLPIIKLADFGFARHLPKTSLAETLCGSPLYMAPEILKYTKYDHSADLWSVGCMMFELSYGRPPFRAANHMELLRKIEQAKDNMEFPSKPPINPDLKTLITSLMKRNPVERLNFPAFFEHTLIKNEIPGTAEADRIVPLQTKDLLESATSDKFVDAVEHVSRPPIQHNYTAPPAQIRKPIPSPRQTSAVKEPVRAQQSRTKQVQDQTAQDIAFERDYVVVEKRNVEVNAFADEVAASPRIHGNRNPPPSSTALQRRNTTQNTPPEQIPSTTPTSRAIQLVSGRKGDHTRQPSFEKKLKLGYPSRVSNVINAASGRLLNLGFSPPLGLGRAGQSPPLYTPFPAYPITPGAPLLLEGGRSTPVDEDTKALHLIEEFAHRSDVVYGFAEVKFKQLIPLAPSEEQGGLGLQLAGLMKDARDDDGGLTVDAVAALSEEALVLYVKVLSLLARTMDIASAWWSRKNRGEDGINMAKLVATSAGLRINKIIQWTRDRFNEVWEKTEYVRMKLLSAQGRLPTDHPMHPDNFPSESLSTNSGDVRISPGVSAEQLMYKRAFEMGRTAAVNELVGEDLPGCDLSYITAIRMLEAILEGDVEPGFTKDTTHVTDTKLEDEDVVDAEDREAVHNGSNILPRPVQHPC